MIRIVTESEYEFATVIVQLMEEKQGRRINAQVDSSFQQ